MTVALGKTNRRRPGRHSRAPAISSLWLPRPREGGEEAVYEARLNSEPATRKPDRDLRRGVRGASVELESFGRCPLGYYTEYETSDWMTFEPVGTARGAARPAQQGYTGLPGLFLRGRPSPEAMSSWLDHHKRLPQLILRMFRKRSSQLVMHTLQGRRPDPEVHDACVDIRAEYKATKVAVPGDKDPAVFLGLLEHRQVGGPGQANLGRKHYVMAGIA